MWLLFAPKWKSNPKYIPSAGTLISRLIHLQVTFTTKMNNKIKSNGDDEWKWLLGVSYELWCIKIISLPRKKGKKINVFIENNFPAFNRIKRIYFNQILYTMGRSVYNENYAYCSKLNILHVFWHMGCPNVILAFRWAYKIRCNNNNNNNNRILC